MKHAQTVLAFIAAAVLSAPSLADHGVDPVLASFERDMLHEPSSHIPQPSRVEVDPLAEALAVALDGYCGAKSHAVASASRQPRTQAGQVGG